MLDELRHYRHISLTRCEMQWRPQIIVLGCTVAAALEQHLNTLDVAAAGVLAQLTTCAALIVRQLPSLGVEVARELVLPLANRLCERCISPPVLKVDVCVTLDQLVDNRAVALAACDVHCRAVVV